MDHNVYAIYDNAAKTYLVPLFVSRNDVVPTREFQQITNSPDSILHAHPGDFQLNKLGTINLDTGELKPSDPVEIAQAVDLLNTQT